MAMTEDEILQRCMELEWRALIRLYGEIQQDQPELVTIPALALREKARSDELPLEVVPILIACMLDAEPTTAVAHLAKALAAFGRAAVLAAPHIADLVKHMPVTNDAIFWTYDGCLHALGYVGDESYIDLINHLASRHPPPVCPKGVYDGAIPDDDRKMLFTETLDRVRELLQRKDGEGWKAKRTKRAATKVAGSAKTPYWMVKR